MELQNALQAIGFTENEAKTYLALLREYPATGYQVSKNSGVPRSIVYEVLSRLHTRGAVLESIEGRATLYRPLDPEILLNEHQHAIRSVIENLKPKLASVYANQVEQKTWTILDRETIFAYARQMLHGAEQEVFLVINDDHYTILGPVLHDLDQKGIDLNILATGEAVIEIGTLAYHPPLESEMQGLTNTLVVLADQTEVLIADTADSPSATITSNPNLIMIARQFIWMEFFTQRIYSQIGADLLDRLDAADREIFKSMIKPHEKRNTP